MNAHTPGPWERRGLTVFAQGATALSIAVATQHQPEARANAALIAGAPDLLAALQACMVHLPDFCADGDQPAIQAACDSARNAIARATGAA